MVVVVGLGWGCGGGVGDGGGLHLHACLTVQRSLGFGQWGGVGGWGVSKGHSGFDWLVMVVVGGVGGCIFMLVSLSLSLSKLTQVTQVGLGWGCGGVGGAVGEGRTFMLVSLSLSLSKLTPDCDWGICQKSFATATCRSRRDAGHRARLPAEPEGDPTERRRHASGQRAVSITIVGILGSSGSGLSITYTKR